MNKNSNNIAILGFGKLGKAISLAMSNSGHSIVAVEPLSNTSRAPATGIRFTEKIEDLRTKGPFDLGVVAIAPENERHYQSPNKCNEIFRKFAQIIGHPSIAYTYSGLTLTEAIRIFQTQSVFRFSCTCSVTEPNAICLYDSNSCDKAKRTIQSILPDPDWRAVASDKFEQQIGWLVASALHCALVALIKEKINEELPSNQCVLTMEDLFAEAQRMVRSSGGAPAIAFNRSSTPGGMTQRFAKELFSESALAHLNNTTC